MRNYKVLTILVVTVIFGLMLAACGESSSADSWLSTQKVGSSWEVEGKVNSVTTDGWVVDGHQIYNPGNVEIVGNVTPGTKARIRGVTSDQKTLVALQVTFVQETASPDFTVVPTVTPTTSGATTTASTTTASATTTASETTTVAETTTTAAATPTVVSTPGVTPTVQVSTSPVEIEGFVQALTATSITIEGQTFTYDPSVILQNGHQLFVGGRAHLSARLINGVLTVVKIIPQGGVNKTPVPGGSIDLEGTIQNITVVNNITVIVINNVYYQLTPAQVSQLGVTLKVGVYIKLTVQGQADGTLVVVKVIVNTATPVVTSSGGNNEDDQGDNSQGKAKGKQKDSPADHDNGKGNDGKSKGKK